jgi:hypothetical protein
LAVPENESEFAPKLLQAVFAMLFIQVQGDFAVAVRRKAVAAAFELSADVPMPVKLAVDDDADLPVLAGDRL